MPDYLETKTIRLKTLSPVHIRAGEGAREYGQAMILLGGINYLIDTPALQHEIFAAGGLKAVEMYADEFSRPGGNKDFIAVLEKIKRNFNFDYQRNIRKISKGIIPSQKGNVLTQSALGQYFIPGSSLKGAMKTAVLYRLLNHPDQKNKLDVLARKQIEKYQTERNRDKFKETFAQKLLVDNFQALEPIEKHVNSKRKPSGEPSFKDFFRAIKIKDAMIELGEKDPEAYGTITGLVPAENKIIITNMNHQKLFILFDDLPSTDDVQVGRMVKIEATENMENEIRATQISFAEDFLNNAVEYKNVVVMSLNQEKRTYKRHSFDNFRKNDNRIQCFTGETKCTIAIDHFILDSFIKAGLNPPFKDISSLLKLCKDFAAEQWQQQQDYLSQDARQGEVNIDDIKSFYAGNKGKATLRIGWGTGMLGTTVDMLLDPTVRKELRNKVIAADRVPKDRPLPAPKSRRYVLNENGIPVSPLGWVQLLED